MALVSFPVRVLRDFSVSTITAGFVAALVGLTASIAIVFKAAQVLGADDAMLASWMLAIFVGVGVMTIVPSLYLRMPVMIAYSVPAAAVLATLKPGDYTMAEGVGAFIVSALVIGVFGFTGLFEKLMNRIPTSLASALLAGVLTRFAISGFAGASTAPWMVVITTLTYVLVRQFAPRYAVVAVLIAGVVVAIVSKTLKVDELRFSVAKPVFTGPAFTLSALIGIAIPVFIVTMAGQNMPGVAVIRNAKYDMPVSKIIGMSGVGTAVLAPFGAYQLNLSAITSGICMDPSSHEDPARRYTAALANGSVYLIVGIFGTSIIGALKAFPTEFVQIIAALALLPTIGINIAAATADESRREAALITFLVTLSGVTVAKIASPFWGTLAGVGVTLLSMLTASRKRKAAATQK
jgi:benzoate membrane transport protein